DRAGPEELLPLVELDQLVGRARAITLFLRFADVVIGDVPAQPLLVRFGHRTGEDTRGTNQALITPCRMAKRTRLGRSPSSSFAMMRLRYVSMLLGFTPTMPAISLLVLPSTTSFRTWRSRGLSPSSAAGFG